LGFKVLDATAFYAGIPFSSQDSYYVTSLVYDEIKHIKKNHGALEILLNSNRLIVKEPTDEFSKKVSAIAKKTGDLNNLSEEDISSIALSLELDSELISDDFGVANVAKQIGIIIRPTMTKGIKTIGKWIHYCPSCGISSKKSICPNCGNKLRKKLVTKN
tara:strand:+ start:142 stop:621 length:480 start_codon:yes stop_codon:yes gene_type:complete